jgi:membrane fusion protein (multidrug efflux system)
VICRLAPVALLATALLAAACGGTGDNDPSSPNAPPPPIQIGDENVVRVKRDAIVTGPFVSGALRAAQEATIRAELGGSVLQVNVDEGQTVKRGTVIARIDTSSLDDARRSAESAVAAARAQLDLARREAQRTEQLVSAGALAVRDLEIARSNVRTVEAQLADAEARLVAAQKDITDAIVRAPINGIVSDRTVNTGDIVTAGSPLFTVIDPSSLRLEASVPSDELTQLRVGATVLFSIRGFEQQFEGRIERISPAADPVTRQVPIFVTVPNTDGRLVAGLYAEGRVVTASANGLVIDANAVNEAEESPWVLRVRDGRTERVEVVVGVRDPRTERVELKAGVNEGDVLLRGSAQAIAPGVQVAIGAPR